MCDDIRDAYNKLCRILADNSEVKSASDRFGLLNSNSTRVNFVHGLLKKYHLQAELKKCYKDNQVAIKFRQDGNHQFKNKNDALALWFYNKSISHSKCDSENLSLAYANRSAVYFEKKLYRECLADIEMALGNYPENLRSKLLQRKDKALAGKQVEVPYYQHLPKLTSDPNRSIQCASDSVEIKNDDNFGRYVVACADISVGDVIAVEKPYVKVLLEECFFDHCYQCLDLGYNLIPCENCPNVLFCSQKCREIAWNLYHRHECNILGTLLNLRIGKLFFTALRIALCAKSEKIEKSKSYRSENYYEIHTLIANTEQRSAADLFKRSVTAALIYDLVDRETDFFQIASRSEFQEMLLLHMQTAPSNFHEISELVEKAQGEHSMIEVGAGTYAFLSLINHSCSPNVVRHCHGTAIVLRALRPIQKGQQLFDNYGYHHAVMGKSERRKHLKDQYYFECNCEACTNDWPLYQELPTKKFARCISDDKLFLLKRSDLETAKKVVDVLYATAIEWERWIPCKNLADVQEITKQCFAIFGNRRIVL